MVRNERSAGLILFRVERGERLYLLLDYGRHWDYPKGHVEPGEDDLGAAWREPAEETGIVDARRVGDFAKKIIYYFRKKSGLVRKEVVFFIACTETREVKLSDEHEGYAFLPYERALDRVTFSTAKEVLRTAEEYLRAHPELMELA